MILQMPLDIIILLGLAIIFGLINGALDSCNIVATIISSRSLSPNKSLIMAAVAIFIGPFLFGVAVARTIGGDLVLPGAVTVAVVICAFLAAIIWNMFTWYMAVPTSASHALLGGLIGSVLISAGYQNIQMNGLMTILISLFAAPVIGLLVGYLVTNILFRLLFYAKPSVNVLLKRIQVVVAFVLALSHGANDSQKIMGGIMLGLLASGTLTSFDIPLWVIVISASAISLGTVFGGFRLIKTVGSKFYKIRPIHGLAAQLSSAIIILSASLLGGPVSTTHIVSTSIMGAGAAERLNKVRWGLAGNILFAWMITIPANILLGVLLYSGYRLIF
jgi:inorganic phosphate transporter, PiT family